MTHDHEALRTEIVQRALALLDRSGVERVEEVDDPGNYAWCREFIVDGIWILEELHNLTIYVRTDSTVIGSCETACCFFDNYSVVQKWNADLVTMVLKTLRRVMILEDLADS